MSIVRRMTIFGRGHGASEPGGTGEPAETPGRGRLTRSVIGWVGAVAVVVSLAGSGWCGWVLFEKHQTDVAAGQALQAARSYVVKLATMDCERIDHNMRDILEGSTGEFKDKYGKSSAHLRQLLANNRVATHGTVVAASVKSATTNKVPTTSIGTPSRNANPAAIGRPTPVTGYTVVCRSARRRGIPTVVSGRRRPRVPSNRSRSQTTL